MQPEFRTDNFNRNIELKGVEGRGHFEIPFFSMSREKARKFWLCFFFTFFFGGGEEKSYLLVSGDCDNN